ncbi:unnamed protein product [Soboliphyme baturini]|uniref:Chitin-binding type-2 domain-containing protein n=1 Tax=Soboliphyme baturini TaxID=241478 RepID=A0A183IK27_9BILA|nr:unnamed protein product [Soboliphyme baturini]
MYFEHDVVNRFYLSIAVCDDRHWMSLAGVEVLRSGTTNNNEPAWCNVRLPIPEDGEGNGRYRQMETCCVWQLRRIIRSGTAAMQQTFKEEEEIADLCARDEQMSAAMWKNSCGKWIEIPCGPGTVFNPELQICTHSDANLHCPANSQSLCRCNVINDNILPRCPGKSFCFQDAACCASNTAAMYGSNTVREEVAWQSSSEISGRNE